MRKILRLGIRTKHDVAKHLVLSHLDMTDSYAQAEHFLELEFDGGADIGELVGEILGVRHGRWELASLGKTGAEETRDLLDESLRRKESVVLFGELLDELLVFVQPSEVDVSIQKAG